MEIAGEPRTVALDAESVVGDIESDSEGNHLRMEADDASDVESRIGCVGQIAHRNRRSGGKSELYGLCGGGALRARRLRERRQRRGPAGGWPESRAQTNCLDVGRAAPGPSAP